MIDQVRSRLGVYGARLPTRAANVTFRLMFISFAGTRMRGQKYTLRNQSYCSIFGL